MQFLPFEAPIATLLEQIEILQNSQEGSAAEAAAEIGKLKKQVLKTTQKVFSHLSDWQVIQLARHPDRPYTLDYIEHTFSDFQELHGDRLFSDDPAIVGGLAKLNGQPVMVIGHQKGRDTKQKIYRNFGMPHPEGYRKALRLMQMAERFRLPIITLIDTPGAYPGIQAETRGQSEAIAHNLREMTTLTVPILCVIIGEGCSGGALGIGVGDTLLMFQYSYFATISPEGCASILWKTADKASEAAEIMGITAERLKALGIVDHVIEEPLGGAHRNFQDAASRLAQALTDTLKQLKKRPTATLLEQRYQRLMQFGRFKENA